MANISTTRPVPFGAVSTFRFVTLVGNVFAAISNRLAARKTYKALSGLSNAQLQDIGLHRSQIRSVANDPKTFR